jgi:hypothetical protein
MPVVLLTREYVADATYRVLDVALATRDKVKVAVEDGLSCDLAVVDAYVESLHARVLMLDRLLLVLEEWVAGVELRLT